MDAATFMGVLGTPAWSASYDAAGNMTCRAPSSATTCLGSSPTGALLSYDNEGRLASWQNAPTSPTSTAAYLYDGAGNRVAEVATRSGGATTTTSFIGGLEAVTTSGSTITTTAYYGGGLAERVNGTLSYLLSDPTLGSASASVSTSTGLVTATQLYAPYGGVRYTSGILPTDYGFTHQRADATTGLDDDGARWYDPVAGQFTSADTTLAGGLNRYAYVAGNPETLVDPTGHEYRLGDDGVGGGLDGGQTSGNSGGGSGGGSGDTSSSSSGDPTTDPVISQVSVGHGETEITYTGTGDSFITDGEGDIVGVVDSSGQLETNAQIEAQAEADSQDRLSQNDQMHGEGGQTEGGSTSENPSLSTSSNSSTSKGNARVSYVASNMQSLAPNVDTNGLTITDQTVDQPIKYSTGSYLPDITTDDSWWEVGGPGKLREIEASKTQITRLAQGAKEYGMTPYYAWDATDMALPNDLQKLLTKWQVNIIQFIMP